MINKLVEVFKAYEPAYLSHVLDNIYSNYSNKNDLNIISVDAQLGRLFFSPYSSKKSFFAAAISPLSETCKSFIDTFYGILSGVYHLFSALAHGVALDKEKTMGSLNRSGVHFVFAFASALVTLLSPAIYTVSAIVRLGQTAVAHFNPRDNDSI